MNIGLEDSLREARRAAASNDHPATLEKYQCAFADAMRIQPPHRAIRLSYCLAEWAELGEIYPPAMAALRQLQQNILASFVEISSRPLLCAHSSLTQSSHSGPDVSGQVSVIPLHDEAQAKELFPFVYDYCASRQMWHVCRRFLDDACAPYRRALDIFDRMMEVAARKTAANSESIRADALAYLRREAQWVLEMLKHAGTAAEYGKVLAMVELDLSARGQEALFASILWEQAKPMLNEAVTR